MNTFFHSFSLKILYHDKILWYFVNMNKILLQIFVLLALLSFNTTTLAKDVVKTYSENNTTFGLKTESGETITKPIYGKLVKLGDNFWIAKKGYKYGILNNEGEFVVKPRYRHVDRYFGKYVKLGNSNDYGLYNSNAELIIPHKFSKIELLFGKMFLTCHKYQYGVCDFNGNIILENTFEDIYMPNPKTMRLKYHGVWFEIVELENNKEIELPDNVTKVSYNNQSYTVTTLINNTGIWSGYSALTFTDYLVKIISSISPAYEATIDDLMLSHGTDTVSIFMNLGWIPKFPVTYAQKYYETWANPYNGPLSDVRGSVKNQLK